jgi:hypothetical protein
MRALVRFESARIYQRTHILPLIFSTIFGRPVEALSVPDSAAFFLLNQNPNPDFARRKGG